MFLRMVQWGFMQNIFVKSIVILYRFIGNIIYTIMHKKQWYC